MSDVATTVAGRALGGAQEGAAAGAQEGAAAGEQEAAAGGAQDGRGRSESARDAPGGSEGPLQLDALHDVELEVVAVLGKTRMTLGTLRSVRPRTTIPLDRPLGSPLEIMVNGKLFAIGELVSVNDSELGVQVKSIVSNRD